MRKLLVALILMQACSPPKSIHVIKKNSNSEFTGSMFYSTVASWNWKRRDSLAVNNILEGNMPSFLKKFVRINTSIKTANGNTIKAYYYVMPDYLSVGTNEDWARIPLTPMAAQKIADSFHCFLSTRKMVDDIYKQAIIKLEPVPMYAFRDSSPTMWQHHLIVEGQRKGRKGLITGIKKDVIITDKLTRDSKKDRVAIYGWYKSDDKPIQPVYVGHVNWYVDYSHGVRLVYRTIWVNGKALDYIDVMKDKDLQKLLCDEEWCDVYRY